MTRSFLRLAALSLAVVFGFTGLHAQSPVLLRPVPQSNRVALNADLGPQTQLTGHIPGWVSNGIAVSKAVDLNANMELTIVLHRDPAVQAAFTQFLADQQTPGNPLYHQWITPQQVGTLFGPTASDLAAVTSWLTAQGLTVDEVQPNQVMINVHGTTSAVANAFRTSFAYFPLNGESRISAVSEPFVPSALAPVVSVVFGLTDLPLSPNSVRTGPLKPDNAGTDSDPKPLLTTTSGNHYMTPGDFAIVYDSNSVLTGGNKGAGMNARVAVIGRSRVAATDISEFASNTNIGTGWTLNTIIPTNGTDPGPVCTVANASTCSTGGDQGEQTLDVDRVIGNAPNATVDLIVATSLTTALQWNVNSVKDPIMTISYGGCESQTGGTSAATTYDTYYSTAAAEGISTFVSSGDSDANGCATAFSAVTATYIAGPNYLCSSSYVTCVGGTEFIDPVASTYWSSTNSTGLISALSYIPEGAWNEPGPASNGTYQTAGTGGGPSLAIAKPSWQTGTGVPNDNHRDTPDMAYPAAQHDSYYACLDYATGNAAQNCTSSGGGAFFGFAGTSAAAPAMAGVAALLNTKLGTAQGNLNPLLYSLAATTSNGVFHDVTVTSSGVSNCSITVPSVCNNSSPGSSALSTSVPGGQQGFLVTAGYDMATGLGSIDVAKFLTAATPTTIATTTALSVSPNPVTVNNTVTLTATITRSSGTTAATGTVSFYYTPSGGTATLIGSPVTVASNAATTTTSFVTAGTYSITAVYSGDTNYTTSTAPGVSLTVNPGPSFTVVPASSSLTLISGATTGNTDVFTLTSTNGFVGSVVTTCTVTNVSGTAAGSCTATTPVALTSGGTGTSTVTITTTPGTAGVLSVTLKGTSGTTVVTSNAVTVTLTASSFTATGGSAISIAAGATTGTSTVALTSVSGFAGTVSFTCTASNPTVTNAGTTTCTVAPATLTAGGTATANVSLTTTLGSSGAVTLSITGTGTTTGATISTSATATVAATVAPPSYSLSTPAALSISPSGATTGNTTSSTITSTAYAGMVTFTCTLTATSGSPASPATCAASSVTLTSGGTATSTITVTSVTAHAARSGPQQAGLTGWGIRGGAMLAMLLCLVPFRRRRFIRSLAAFALLACGLVAISGCGGSGAAAVKSSSDGTYTGTVSGSGTSTGAGAAFTSSTTFTLTITN
jgi:subtilase family serine protease